MVVNSLSAGPIPKAQKPRLRLQHRDGGLSCRSKSFRRCRRQCVVSFCNTASCSLSSSVRSLPAAGEPSPCALATASVAIALPATSFADDVLSGFNCPPAFSVGTDADVVTCSPASDALRLYTTKTRMPTKATAASRTMPLRRHVVNVFIIILKVERSSELLHQSIETAFERFKRYAPVSDRLLICAEPKPGLQVPRGCLKLQC